MRHFAVTVEEAGNSNQCLEISTKEDEEKLEKRDDYSRTFGRD
jgi:hypothetical protein